MKRISTSSLWIAALLVIEVLTSTLPAAAADTPGVWKLTGSMATSRRNANRELLPDGRILVVGGTNTTGVDGSASIFYDTAEIYDPATGTWTATGSLTTGGRALHTIARLPDGKLLVAGGWNGSAALSSAEIYDPATGTWTATGSMGTARAQHRDQVLFDGRVLITGGFDSSGNPIASAEIYTYNTQTGTGTFSATNGSMLLARYGHRMNNVGADNVLITGGFGAGGVALASSELFNPASGGNFTAPPTAALAHARGKHFSTMLPTGEILVTGGHAGGAALNSTELYDPDTGTFTDGANLNQARQSHSSSLLPNGLVLISGGNTSSSADWDIQTSFLMSAELYDRKTNTITPTGSKITAASNSAGFPLWTGKFLSAGGGTNKAELYNPAMPGTIETWVATGRLVTARTSHQQTLLDDGRVLMTGGLPDSTGVSAPLKSAETYDYLTGNFTATGDMSIERQQHRTALLYTGKVLVTGGRPFADTNVLNSAELYDPATGVFSATGNMLRFRRLHRATNLPKGKILITGGLGGTLNTSNSHLSLAELYDPATELFTQTAGGLATARRGHQATLLYTGKVLVAGGRGAAGVLASAELYNPATNNFSATGNMVTARNSPNLTRLPNGNILVSGGTDAADLPIQSLEIYDPAAGTFTAVGDMSVARDGRTTRLDSGKLLMVGGSTLADDEVDTVELYSHVTGTVSPTDNLITGRKDHSQTSLPNGRILVAGGVGGEDTVLAFAELYTPLIGDAVDTTITSGPAELTTSTSATFNFSSTPAGGTFTCTLDGSAFTGCVSGQSYSSLADGSHNFQVHATDALGNTDPTPANHNWTVDTTAPNALITGPVPDSGGATKSTSATFNFWSNEAGSTYACSLDGAPFAACASPKSYTKLKVGSHTFQVKATDLAGNVGAPASFNWTIDTKAPNTTITSFPPTLTNNPVATFTFTSTEVGGGFQCSLDGSPFAPCTSPFVSSPLADGKHNFQVKAVDAAGNVDKSAAKAKAWTVDTTLPVTTIKGKPADPTTSTSATFKFTSEKKCTFQCKLDLGPFEACKSGKKYSGLLPGPHTFQVQATDAATNVELTPASYSWTQN